jgi:Ca2+-binding RTX toxin-like protein
MLFQSLESRTLFAATAVLDSSSHELRIKGTSSNDVIELWKSSSSLKVKLNGSTKTFTYSQVNTVHATLGSGDDKMTMNNNVVKAAYIAGEDGKDTLVGGGQNDYLTGGNNNDTLDGGTGDDILVGNGGTDTADFSNRTYDLKITLDNNANDGAKSGGHDNVKDDVENVKCGSGNDEVIGSSKNNKIEGGPGKDTIKGQGGNDSLYGNSGDDKLSGNTGNDKCYGGDGNDWIDISDSTFGDYAQGDSGNDECYFDKSGSNKDSVTGCEILHS